MNVMRGTIMGGLAVLLALAAVSASAAELPDAVEAAIVQAQAEGASAREARRVARYAYENGGEAEALRAMISFRKMLGAGVEEREAGKAVMKTVRARVRAAKAGEKRGARVRDEAGAGDGTGERTRTRTREENNGEDAAFDGVAGKRVEEQLREKKEQRLRERERVRQREEEARMEERRNRSRSRGEAESGAASDTRGRR